MNKLTNTQSIGSPLNPSGNDDALTRAELAARMGVHPRTIKRWEALGLPVLKITRRTVRYVKGDVDRFLSRSRIAQPLGA